jgi:hypothetical protein
MSNIKKHPIWFWGFIILLVLNISATTAMLIASKKIHNNIENGTYNKRVAKYHKYSNKKVDRNNKAKAWKDLDFTKEQRLFIRTERKKHIEKMQVLKGQLQTTQSKLFDQLAKGEDNTKELKSDLLAIHDAILEENINFYEQLKSKLSEEQMQAIKAHIDRQFRVEGKMPKFKRKPGIAPPPPPPPPAPPRH